MKTKLKELLEKYEGCTLTEHLIRKILFEFEEPSLMTIMEEYKHD